jgi:8-oxo-dGTP diphosphatase
MAIRPREDNPSAPSRQALFEVEVVSAVFRILIRHERLEVLLVRAADESSTHTWALPGGPPLPGEQLDDAATREVLEHTWENAAYLEQVQAFDDPSPSRGPNAPAILVAYVALLPMNAANERWSGPPPSTALKWRWWPVQDLPHIQDNHQIILDAARQRVAKNAESSPMAFSVLDEEFSMSELRLVHEALTGQSTSENNFQRLMANRWNLERAGSRGVGRGRPAALYRFQPPTQDGTNTFDGQLPLDEVLAKCRSVDTPIWIGFTGGPAELSKRPAEYLRSRPWRWRSSLERTVKANWIPGNVFLRLIDEASAGDEAPSSTDSGKARWDHGLHVYEVVERCMANPKHETFIGYYGGRDAFQHITAEELMRRRWKWHDPQRHRFVETGNTWIPHVQFVRRVIIALREQPDPAPSPAPEHCGNPAASPELYRPKTVEAGTNE